MPDTNNAEKVTILDKVRKLRALASSTNVHEAAAAAAAAAKLLLEHNLSEAELSSDEEPDEAPVTEALDGGEPLATTWKSNLSTHLETANGCAGFIRRTFRGGHWVVLEMVVGRPQDVATVKYLYAWLTSEIVRLCNASDAKGRTARNSFCLGAVAGVAEAMAVATKPIREAAQRSEAGSAAMVRVDARLDAAKAALPEGLRLAGGASSRIDHGAYAAGKQAGRAIHTGRSLGGGHKLLGGSK